MPIAEENPGDAIDNLLEICDPTCMESPTYTQFSQPGFHPLLVLGPLFTLLAKMADTNETTLPRRRVGHQSRPTVGHEAL